ncbi:hypothetical protein HOP50_17g79700 [Chloropicon primus]|uniref:Uncharacterized protein n=1 Tax=Chloropicon primus TaxID=1764295 RepID=A0A5B8MXV9_9CHLO|nr:hypothetical protein A3770_17p79470 [Chloropicon primus]UPR04626.1 hypothetical protein HOP50_17g79700 [Chloropicon primus]|mmetsp:Transcript_24094/g.51799  ORF Transcript_24094/g.51799 Transcript_24094/m.51799 type:complete len:252 (+) Transcript_24094:215-970(+)|eukprot:QDZ25429.1 hypothetical protein A3770_17p79470 [Chloropicon primus]
MAWQVTTTAGEESDGLDSVSCLECLPSFERAGFVLLTRFTTSEAADSLEEEEVTVWATDGRRAWRGTGLRKPAGSHELWAETLMQALGGKGGCSSKREVDLVVEADSVGDLRVQWSWKDRIQGDEIKMKCTLGRSLERLGEASASTAILSMMCVLADSHKSVGTAKREQEQLKAKYDRYRDREEQRMKAVLRKCTGLLNEKKEKIRQLQLSGGHHDGQSDHDQLNLFLLGGGGGAGDSLAGMAVVKKRRKR